MMESELLEPPPDQVASGPAVLAFEDEYETLDGYAQLLKNRGAQVTSTVSGYEAIEHVGRQHFDAAIIDINDQEGYPVGVQLFSQFVKRYPNARVLVISAARERREQVENLGGTFLDKPVDPEEIKSFGEFVYSRHKMLQEQRYVPLKLREATASGIGHPLETTVEHLSEEGCTVSFYDDRQSEWMMLDVPLPKELRQRVFPDMPLRIIVQYDPCEPGRILGISVPAHGLPSEPPDERQRLGFDGRPLPVPDDYDDPEQVARYTQALGAMFSSTGGQTELMKEIEAEQGD